MSDNKHYYYLCLILGVIFIFLGIFFNFKYYNSVVKNYFVEKSNVDYMVCLKENDFYKQSCLTEDKEYLASLTDEIRLTFKYDRIYNKKTNSSLKYYATSKVIIYNRENNKEIFVDENRLTDEKALDSDKEVASIVEEAIVKFDDYKKIVDRYIQNYSINSKAELKIVLNLIDGESVSSVASLVIPLLEPTYSITKDLVNSDNNENVSVASKNYLFISILLFVLAFLLIVLTLYRMFKKVTDSPFELEVNKLLSDYDRIIVESKGNNYDLSDKQLIELDSFIELVDVRDTLEKPIVYVRKNEYTRDFIVQDNEIAYRYRMLDKK